MGIRDRLRGVFGGDGPDEQDGDGVEDRDAPPAPTGGRPESRSTSSHAASAAEQRRRADDLAAEWAGYDLDGSPASLERLDELIADEFDGSPPDVDRAELRAESPPGVVPEGARLALGSGGASADVAAYVGEVFVRSHGATWRDGGDRPLIEVQGSDGTAELDPLPLVSAAIRGHVSLARTHDAVADDVGLER